VRLTPQGVGLLIVLLAALVWALALLGVEWERVGLQLAAAALLLLGSVLIFVALVKVDRPIDRPWSHVARGRRPAGANTRRPDASVPFPSRADVAHGSTSRPRPGGGLTRSRPGA